MPNILRRKGNQIIKFGQLIDYNMRNIFLEKSYTKYGGKTSPRSFSEKLKLCISLDQYSNVLYSLFLLHTKLRAIEIYWSKAADHFPLPHLKLFKTKKTKNSLELVSLHYFLHNFWRKIFFLIYFINWSAFIVRLSLLHEILGEMSIAIVWNQVVTSWI